MKAGDLVRYRRATPPGSRLWEVGLLVDYKSWEKIARILCKDGTIVAIAARDVQKYGGRGYRKKDYDKEKE